MSNSRDFSDTSASRYSLALYELADEWDQIKEIENNSMAFLKLISESSEFNSLIKDPTNKQNEISIVISSIGKKYNLNALFTKFLNFLVSKRRFFFMEKILRGFVDLCSKKRGEIKAQLLSAKKLDENEINNIKKELEENLKSKIKLDYLYDESLIGGLVMKVGSTMVDTSIKNKLQQIEKGMIEA